MRQALRDLKSRMDIGKWLEYATNRLLLAEWMRQKEEVCKWQREVDEAKALLDKEGEEG